MNHTSAYIDDLIREGMRLKNRLENMTKNLERSMPESREQIAFNSAKSGAYNISDNNISFLSAVPGWLKDSITDVFSLICGLKKVENGGVYLFNGQLKSLGMVCHYNLPSESLARLIEFGSDSWQVYRLLRGKPGIISIHDIPIHARLVYEQSGISDIALIPLTSTDRVIGCIILAFRGTEKISGFEEIMLQEITSRLARTVELHLACVKLLEANTGLNGFMKKFNARLLMMQPFGSSSLTRFFLEMKNEIDSLSRSLSLAVENILKRMDQGFDNRQLPFRHQKVDEILHDLDVIVQIIHRLRVFCISQEETLGRGIIGPDAMVDAPFMESMVLFYNALETLVMEAPMKRPAITSFIAGRFEPIAWPVKLADLKFSVNRYNPN